ncbi:hypothetical protein Back11_58100 [Paenibacillus baekrokdamisoli]|uniref:Uncharacterized protein n=1 Tax=Paenibacillus baekrokdamisoli TaxID=1712516 RepID=A0A3G9J7X2_9BACL|nr:hypothetical protein [Paenibacillus baekrokdamisoli]BBH24465.1 hypothetical protein Back11_58100 [Paenibacillus baekrokdamisoli]
MAIRVILFTYGNHIIQINFVTKVILRIIHRKEQKFNNYVGNRHLWTAMTSDWKGIRSYPKPYSRFCGRGVNQHFYP